MICRSCGKECPDNTKFCIYCGELLEDPDKAFMGEKFETTEECSIVKSDYKTLTENFELGNCSYGEFAPDASTHTLKELQNAINECKQGKYHPVASKLALDYIEPLFKKQQFFEKRKRRLKIIRILSYIYAVTTALILLTQPIATDIRLGDEWTFLEMLRLIIPGTLGTFSWVWNLGSVVAVIFIGLYFFRLVGSSIDNKPENIFLSPLFVVAACIGVFLISLIPWFIGLSYQYSDGCAQIIVIGVLLQIVDCIIMPKKPKEEQEKP